MFSSNFCIEVEETLNLWNRGLFGKLNKSDLRDLTFNATLCDYISVLNGGFHLVENDTFQSIIRELSKTIYLNMLL